MKLSGCHGDTSVEQAIMEAKHQIDQGRPIPYLLLRHKNVNFKDLVWHWFMLVGYEELEDEFYVKIATYGGYRWLNFKELWDTGFRKKGGMILVQVPDKLQ